MSRCVSIAHTPHAQHHILLLRVWLLISPVDSLNLAGKNLHLVWHHITNILSDSYSEWGIQTQNATAQNSVWQFTGWFMMKSSSNWWKKKETGLNVQTRVGRCSYFQYKVPGCSILGAEYFNKVPYLWCAELHKCLYYQRECQSVDGCQLEVTSTHLTFELNSAPCYPPENWLGRFNHVYVPPVNELLDNPPFLYSRLTAPVDFNWTLHHSHCPAPQRLSAVSGEMI